MGSSPSKNEAAVVNQEVETGGLHLVEIHLGSVAGTVVTIALLFLIAYALYRYFLRCQRKAQKSNRSGERRVYYLPAGEDAEAGIRLSNGRDRSLQYASAPPQKQDYSTI